VFEALATASALAFGDLDDQHHLLRTDGQGVDTSLPFATPPILLALTMRAMNGLLFDGQMELHPALNILRAAILVAFSHAKRVI